MRHTPELELDRALSGWPVEDPTVADLSDLASRVQHWLGAEPPPARRQRALFTGGVVAAHRARPSRALKFAMAAAALLITLGWVSGNALPGDTLYPVRNVLEKVGLAQSALEEIDELTDRARIKVESAESTLDERPALAERLAGDAISDLNDATRLLAEVGEQTDRRSALIAGLELRATRVIERALDALKTGNLPGAKVENNAGNNEGRRRDSESDGANNDDEPNGGNHGGRDGLASADDGPNTNDDTNDDDASEGQDRATATGDDDDDGGAASDQDGDDADEPDAGGVNNNDNDTGDGDDAEEIEADDHDVAESDEENVD